MKQQPHADPDGRLSRGAIRGSGLRTKSGTLPHKRHTGQLNAAMAVVRTGDLASLKRLLRPLRHEFTADMAGAFLRLKADAKVQARYEMLARRNNEGSLTPSQRDELGSLVRANSLLSVIKAEAQAFLKQPKAA